MIVYSDFFMRRTLFCYLLCFMSSLPIIINCIITDVSCSVREKKKEDIIGSGTSI